MTVKELLDALDLLELSAPEKTAYNYLLEEEYDGLPFRGLEGDRLRALCVSVLEERYAQELA